ncbi:MAG: histidinol phosphatase [Candidatus Cloacimonetes bacterium HGW-Cloacimonetes-3]|jgi:histidinol-phosphatase (PHP family)|nr:MAG: histidinol phosphatase [Candidatus Cloacimonetes bacterium HGW-Cloacimonetes-3]
MKYDYHLHTEDSFDSKIKAEELVQRAIELGYDEIAITEHLDLLPEELRTNGLMSLSKYHSRIRALQHIYPQLRILCGIEIGDYHRVKDYAAGLIEGLDFDIIIGSVHFLSDHTNVAMPLLNPLSEAQVKEYYEFNLELVSTCDIDVLGHLGVYKRYYKSIPDETMFLPLIREIFATMIKRGIALEINFGPLRRGYKYYHPEPEHLELYRAMGGNMFSIGSDAHRLADFDDYMHCIPELYRNLATDFAISKNSLKPIIYS